MVRRPIPIGGFGPRVNLGFCVLKYEANIEFWVLSLQQQQFETCRRRGVALTLWAPKVTLGLNDNRGPIARKIEFRFSGACGNVHRQREALVGKLYPGGLQLLCYFLFEGVSISGLNEALGQKSSIPAVSVGVNPPPSSADTS